MKNGDIIVILISHRGHKSRERTVVRTVTGESFLLEFIEGPFDGQRFRMTRTQLDSNQELDTGGENWKEK